jgi:hypothetical protein
MIRKIVLAAFLAVQFGMLASTASAIAPPCVPGYCEVR